MRWQFLPFLGTSLPCVTFLPAVLAAFLFCGRGAGLLAASLSTAYVSVVVGASLGDILIVHDHTERLIAFFSLLTCIVICLVYRSLHQARQQASRAEERAREAQQRALVEAQLRERELRHHEKIVALNAELEQRVRERTADLEAAIREQQAFSYSVSHDLRAPLRHINSFSAVLLEDYGADLCDEARHYLERIKSSTNSMSSLIDDLLQLSHLSRMELARERVDLSQQVANIATMLQETEPHRQVEFVYQEGLFASGDQRLLKQLLENLLVNAWKYSGRRPDPRIEFGKTLVDGQEAFFVRDNGVGFDMNYSDKLFEAFQRLHGDQFEGTGVGLATAQRIISRHGGAIWAEGKVDEGATFYFTLPEPQAADQAPATLSPPIATEPRIGR